jgi:hypothetical protein
MLANGGKSSVTAPIVIGGPSSTNEHAVLSNLNT